MFAIAITLLVLAIRVPETDADLGHALLSLWPSYVAYVMSFIVIGAIWINHHSMFTHIARVDAWVMILNLLQLLFIAFLPFPTEVLARAFLSGVDASIATAFYGGTLSLLGAVVTLTWHYAAANPRLLDDRITPEKVRLLRRRYLVGPVLYAAASVIGLVAPIVAVVIFIGANVYFLLPRRSSEGLFIIGAPRARPPADDPASQARPDEGR